MKETLFTDGSKIVYEKCAIVAYDANGKEVVRETNLGEAMKRITPLFQYRTRVK